jgi:Tfp pilus assembly protein PilX
MGDGAVRQSGFALIAALLAVWILTAVGVLVFTITTQDVRMSTRMVGEKKAFFATEAGIHSLTQGFNPLNLTDSAKYNKYFQVDSEQDPASRYQIGTPAVPAQGPASISIPGYAVGGGQQWGATRFVATVTGTNTNFGTMVQVDVGVGFGPVEVSTAYR